MKDEQIIKALERCGQHRECCYCNSVEECGNKRVLTASTLDLINRQKAENSELVGKIDKLQAEIEKYENIKTTIDEFWDILLKIKMAKRKEKPTLEELAEAIEEIETEAIKEYKEKVIEVLLGKSIFPVLVKNALNEVEKELVGDLNGKRIRC